MCRSLLDQFYCRYNRYNTLRPYLSTINNNKNTNFLSFRFSNRHISFSVNHIFVLFHTSNTSNFHNLHYVSDWYDMLSPIVWISKQFSTMPHIYIYMISPTIIHLIHLLNSIRLFVSSFTSSCCSLLSSFLSQFYVFGPRFPIPFCVPFSYPTSVFQWAITWISLNSTCFHISPVLKKKQ